MNDPSFIWIHRLQNGITSGFEHLSCDFLCKLFEGFLSLFPIAAAVQRNFIKFPFGTVADQRGQILERVQRLAPAPDDGAEILPVNG